MRCLPWMLLFGYLEVAIAVSLASGGVLAVWLGRSGGDCAEVRVSRSGAWTEGAPTGWHAVDGLQRQHETGPLARVFFQPQVAAHVAGQAPA